MIATVPGWLYCGHLLDQHHFTPADSGILVRGGWDPDVQRRTVDDLGFPEINLHRERRPGAGMSTVRTFVGVLCPTPAWRGPGIMMALSSDSRTDGLRPGIVGAARGSSHPLPC